MPHIRHAYATCAMPYIRHAHTACIPTSGNAYYTHLARDCQARHRLTTLALALPPALGFTLPLLPTYMMHPRQAEATPYGLTLPMSEELVKAAIQHSNTNPNRAI